jgi:hypothetical protein
MVASWKYIILTANADAMELKVNLMFKLDEMRCSLYILWMKIGLELEFDRRLDGDGKRRIEEG